MSAITTSTVLPGVQTTTPLLGEQPSPTITTPGRSSLDLFPTAATGAATATATSNSSGQGSSSPSLYLIVFLSILVLLLVTSIGIGVRAIYFRRRHRNNVDRAMARGELFPDWAPPGSAAGLYDYSWWRSWGMARYFGSNLDADDLDGFVPGDWRHHTGGRRRKNRKDYGEIPVLHETDLSEAHAYDDSDGDEWESKQPLAIAVPHKCLYDSLQEGSAGKQTQIGESGDRDPKQPPDQSLPTLNYDNNRSVTSSASPCTCDRSLHIRYLIRMPESEAAIASRSQPDEYGEIVSHGPIEIGLWQPDLGF